MQLIDQLAFYGTYHHHPINQLIHFVFVPTILWSILVFLHQLHPLTSLLIVLIYSIFYVYLDPIAGGLWALLVATPLAWSASLFAAQPHIVVLGTPCSTSFIALVIHVFSWYMQIHPGHAVFEKRKPALMDSLIQAFALAPLFVFYELLFLLGYRPKLRKDLSARIEKDLKKLQKAKR